MEEMAGYAVDAPSEEQRWRLFRLVNGVTDQLTAQGRRITPAIVAKLMEQRGYPVTITRERGNFYLIMPKES